MRLFPFLLVALIVAAPVASARLRGGIPDLVCTEGPVEVCADHVGVKAGDKGFCEYVSTEDPLPHTEPCGVILPGCGSEARCTVEVCVWDGCDPIEITVEWPQSIQIYFMHNLP